MYLFSSERRTAPHRNDLGYVLPTMQKGAVERLNKALDEDA